MDIWTLIQRFFTKNEAWGDWSKINPVLLYVNYALRCYAKQPIIIHCAYELSGHMTDSQHYLGNAADWHFNSNDPFFSQIDTVVSFLSDYGIFDKVGLGIYPAWNNPGFHLDVRGHYSRWGWVGDIDEQGNKKYVSFEEAKNYARNKRI